MTFYERYEELCTAKGVAPKGQKAAKCLGCSKNSLCAMQKSGITPRGEMVAGAATMLGVSADYLLGLIDNPRPIENCSDLSSDELEIIMMLRGLNEEGMIAAKSMLQGISNQNLYKKDCEVSENNKEA